MRVTVGIPAYNEEHNILNLLRSIVDNDVSLVSEIIVSDDSSDETPRIVRQFAQDSRIPVVHFHHPKRRGAASAWNEIFCHATGDTIVLYDADTVPCPDCTARLAASLSEDVALCASNARPLRARGVAGRASAFISNWLRVVRRAQLSRYTVMGRGLAIDSAAAKRVTIPREIIAIDLYLQCAVMDMGLGVAYNDAAVVHFRPAESMEDLASQVLRAINGHRQVREHIERLGMGLPLHVALAQIARTVISDPVGAASVAIGYSPLPYYRSRLAGINSALWHTTASSKSLDLQIT
jgi:glycosyltransferase involved in cell wall biosynthesis